MPSEPFLPTPRVSASSASQREDLPLPRGAASASESWYVSVSEPEALAVSTALAGGREPAGAAGGRTGGGTYSSGVTGAAPLFREVMLMAMRGKTPAPLL